MASEAGGAWVVSVVHQTDQPAPQLTKSENGEARRTILRVGRNMAHFYQTPQADWAKTARRECYTSAYMEDCTSVRHALI